MATGIRGIHHITAIASDPQPNLDFYTGFLGLRLVKRTVNFDDPGTYHFYFGDRTGQPGTILTFFPWPGARRGRQGTGQLAAVSFAVESLDPWRRKAADAGVMLGAESERFGEPVIAFEDPDGLPLEFIETIGPAGGFAAPTIALEGFERTAKLLTDTFGFRKTAEDGERFRFQSEAGGMASAVDLVCRPDSQRGLGGAGTVHHIAWRAADDAEQAAWRAKLTSIGYDVTPVMDRNYFRSIYFREPGGVLFEIATDPPGFTADEPEESLGDSLKLPPQYEHLRSRIESVLPPLRLPSRQ